jgi:hypothetical protein
MWRRKERAPEADVMRTVSPSEMAEHDALERLHRARAAHSRAWEATKVAERLNEDAAEALDAAKREVRRLAERA